MSKQGLLCPLKDSELKNCSICEFTVASRYRLVARYDFTVETFESDHNKYEFQGIINL